MQQGLKAALWRSLSLLQRDTSHILIAWILRRTICGTLPWVIFAICNQTQPNATLLLGCGGVFFPFLVFYLSLILPLLFIVSFQALISSLLNIISYWLRCNGSQARIYTSSLIKPVRMICYMNARKMQEGNFKDPWVHGHDCIGWK